MRFALAALAVALAVAGCGRSVTVVRPFAEARADLNGTSHATLVLANGDRISLGEVRLLGEWVCGGTGPATGDFCLRSAGVQSVEKTEYRPGLEVIALIPMAIPAAIWIGSDEAEKRERREQQAEDVETHRRLTEEAIASGRPPPPPRPTPESWRRAQSSNELARCLDVKPVEDEVEPRHLADEVWRKPRTCIGPASEWFIAHGQVDKGRRLSFVDQARARYLGVACGGSDPGLDAPSAEAVGSGGASWIGEYRAVVADSGVYADLAPECRDPIPARAVLDRVRSTFPLTEFGPVPRRAD